MRNEFWDPLVLKDRYDDPPMPFPEGGGETVAEFSHPEMHVTVHTIKVPPAFAPVRSNPSVEEYSRAVIDHYTL